MTERILTPLLAFMLLAGGTLAVGSELFRAPHAGQHVAEVASVQLPRVEVIGHRVAAEVASAQLPRVEVTGHRVAADVATARLPRVEVTGRRAVVTVRLAEPAASTVCTSEEAAAGSGGATATHI